MSINMMNYYNNVYEEWENSKEENMVMWVNKYVKMMIPEEQMRLIEDYGNVEFEDKIFSKEILENYSNITENELLDIRDTDFNLYVWFVREIMAKYILTEVMKKMKYNKNDVK